MKRLQRERNVECMNAAEAKRARFRELLNSPGIIPTAVAYDCLSARIFEQAGFELLGMGMTMAPSTTKGLRRNRRKNRLSPLCT